MADDGPVQLLAVDTDGKLTINQSAAEELSKIEEPVKVIGIVGKYRTGKSFLMNRLLGKCSGFSLGPTVQSHTKGVWMWLSRQPDGYTLLLDTEGQNDVEGNSDRSVQIYVLLVVVSGCLLLNCQNVIDESIFQLLELVGELAEKLPDSLGEKDDEMQAVFPALFLVVRDFFLDLKLDGETCTADEYLESNLKLKRSHRADDEKRNELRERLTDLFPVRHCVTLPRPVKEEKKLQKVGQLKERDLDRNFRTQCDNLCKSVNQAAKAKLFRGSQMTGAQLVHLIEKCVTSFRHGVIPSLQTTFDSMAQSECKKGLDLIMKAYSNKAAEISRDMPMSEEELKELHDKAYDDACASYSDFAHLDTQNECFDDMKAKLQKELEVLMHHNEKAGLKYCREAIYLLYNVNVKANIERGAYIQVDGPTKYDQDYQKILNGYAQLPQKVPRECAQQVLEEFEEERQSERIAIQKNAEELRRKEAEIAAKLRELDIETENRKKAECEIQQVSQQMVELEKRNQEDLRATKEALQRRHEEHSAAVSEDHKREMATYRSEADDMRNLLEEKKRENLKLLQELMITSNHLAEQERATLEMQNRQLEKALTKLKSPPPKEESGGCTIS